MTVHLSLKPTSVPARTTVTVLAVALAPGLYTGFLASQRDGSFAWGFLAAFSLIASAAFAILYLPVFARALRNEIVVDEGGVRCVVGGQQQYFGFDVLGIPTVNERDGLAGEGHLVLAAADGPAYASFPLLGPRALENARLLAAAIAEGVRRTRRRTEGLAVLARGHRDLEAWRADLDAAVCQGDERSVYRGGLDLEALHRRLADVAAPIAERAAAAYALLSQGEEHVEKVRLALPDAPPLVTAMVRIAPGGRALVSDADVEAALDYLDDADRQAVERALQ